MEPVLRHKEEAGACQIYEKNRVFEKEILNCKQQSLGWLKGLQIMSRTEVSHCGPMTETDQVLFHKVK